VFLFFLSCPTSRDIAMQSLIWKILY